MKEFQENLACKYNYKCLPNKISKDVRMKYLHEVPKFLKLNGDDIRLCSKDKNILIIEKYDRIVIGDYGAFIEFDITNAGNFTRKNSEGFRLNVDHNSKYVDWYPTKCFDEETTDFNCKVYWQKSRVKYADYIPGKYYVSVHDVKIEEDEN